MTNTAIQEANVLAWPTDDYVRILVADESTSAWGHAWAAHRLNANLEASIQPAVVYLLNMASGTTVLTTESPSAHPAPARSPSNEALAQITWLRETARLPWDAIAGALRVSRQSLHNWRRGEPITRTNRNRIAVLTRTVQEALATAGAPDPAEYLLGLVAGNPNQTVLAGLALDADRSVERVARLSAYDRLVSGDGEVADVPDGHLRTQRKVKRVRAQESDYTVG